MSKSWEKKPPIKDDHDGHKDGDWNTNSNKNHNSNSNSNDNWNSSDLDVKADVDVDVKVDIDVKVDVDVVVKGDHALHDNDVNDIDNHDLINVAPGGKLEMGDFVKRDLAVGNSFNDGGNDSLTRVNQSNSLTDLDILTSPLVDYYTPDVGLIQKVTLEGGDKAESDDGIHGDSTANSNVGDGSVSGSTSAVADAVGNISAFTQDITMGGNTQANLSTITAIGGDSSLGGDKGGDKGGGWGGDEKVLSAVETAGKGHEGEGNGDNDGGGHRPITDLDNDVNDIDQSDLINVAGCANLTMDDFTLDVTAIGNSFNGHGNDMMFDVNQVNDMVDNDNLCDPIVQYRPSGWSDAAFQDIYAEGGKSEAGSGIDGNSHANGNGGAGLVSGASNASASANVTAEAFTQNIVMGANLQLNNSSLSLIGGDFSVGDHIDAH